MGHVEPMERSSCLQPLTEESQSHWMSDAPALRAGRPQAA